MTHTEITEGDGIDEYTDDRGIKIHECPDCKISLLCGNLSDEDTGSTDSRSDKRAKAEKTIKYETQIVAANLINMASIITLVEFHGAKILICGDAVGVTEKFILDTYLDILDVELLRAPHHGSNTYDSSHLAFVKRMNPRKVVFSAGLKCRSQDLPTCDTITRYVKNAPRLLKDEDDNVVPESTWTCFYYDDSDRAGFLSRGVPVGKAFNVWYNSAAKAKASVRTTGAHDDNVYAWAP